MGYQPKYNVLQHGNSRKIMSPEFRCECGCIYTVKETEVRKGYKQYWSWCPDCGHQVKMDKTMYEIKSGTYHLNER